MSWTFSVAFSSHWKLKYEAYLEILLCCSLAQKKIPVGGILEKLIALTQCGGEKIVLFSKIVTHDAKMNVMRIVYFSLDIICTLWGLRKSRWTFGRNSVRVQYRAVIPAVKASCHMRIQCFFQSFLKRRVMLLLVESCPVPERHSGWWPVEVYLLLVWIQWIWRITGIWEYFLYWRSTMVRSFWGIGNVKSTALHFS